MLPAFVGASPVFAAGEIARNAAGINAVVAWSALLRLLVCNTPIISPAAPLCCNRQ